MAQGSSHHSDAEMAAELSEADQQRAIARLAADYKQANRPPLTAAERQEREGNVTLPFTPELRETLVPISTKNIFFPYLLLGTLVLSAWAIIVGVALPGKYFVVFSWPPVVLLIPLYFVFARWMHARRVAEVNRLQSYNRYAGQCEIRESSYITRNNLIYTYQVDIPSLSAPIVHMTFQFPNGDKHKEACDVTWGTIDYYGRRILSVRDDRDHTVYRFSDGL